MSESFAPNEPVSRFENNTTVLKYWPLILLAVFPIGWAATKVPDVLSGNNAPYPLRQFIIGTCAGGMLIAITVRQSRRLVKWLQMADRGGIQWYTRGRVWQYSWDQLVSVDLVESVYYPQPDGTMGLCYQTMRVKFDDEASLEIQSEEFDKYLVIRHYLLAKQDQASVAARYGRTAPNAATWDEAERAGVKRIGDDQATRFGPLLIYRRGVEWDGMYYSWEQIEGYEIRQGFLILRSVDGDEFLKRTADLGDWRTAIEQLEAAAGQMSGRRKTAADRPATTPRKRT